MNLYIRHNTVSEVLVADRDTGYAVATFFYQRGDDNKPKFDARALAEKFIALSCVTFYEATGEMLDPLSTIYRSE